MSELFQVIVKPTERLRQVITGDNADEPPTHQEIAQLWKMYSDRCKRNDMLPSLPDFFQWLESLLEEGAVHVHRR